MESPITIYRNWTIIKLSVDPNAVPSPKNAAIDEEAISFSRLWTVFGAQISAILARYPLLNAKNTINMMKT